MALLCSLRFHTSTLLVALALSSLGGCRRPSAPTGRPAPSKAVTVGVVKLAAPAVSEAAMAPICGVDDSFVLPRPLRRCFAELPAWVDSPVALLLDRARENLDHADFEGTLACAGEAARQMPRSVEAHHDRAIALVRLGRLEEARDALTLALSLAPRDAETLELAADVYINHLPPTAERASIGLEYARRGRKGVAANDRDRIARLALLEAQALIDLGRSADALVPAGIAYRHAPRNPAARYERGVALFELCRFDEAKRAFQEVLTLDAGHAHALYHLALIDERDGNDTVADEYFAEASRRDPKAFPPVPSVSLSEFTLRLNRVKAALSQEARADLDGIAVNAEELPDIDDLTAESPPLSPTILGLFRGLPLGRDDSRPPPTPMVRGGLGRQGRVLAGASANGNPASYITPDRAIILYRRNMLRSITNVADLDRAIERTLLHEIGHLRGEDDGSLRDRGLE